MKIKLNWITVAVCVAVSACASAPEPIALSAERASTMQGRTLVGVTQRRPDYFPMRASSSAFGAIGAIAEINAGRSFPEEHSLVDPATRIEDRLITYLNQRHQSASGERLDLTAAQEDTPYPIAAETVYVDVQSMTWGESYFSFNWGRFRLNYAALIQLIDGSNGQVMAQFSCQKVSHEDADSAPTLQELDVDNSALRNGLFTRMADECANEFESTLGANSSVSP